MEPIVKCSAGLDVHKSTVVWTVLREDSRGEVSKEPRQYLIFLSRLREWAQWLNDRGVKLAVLESTCIYWQSVYAALEQPVFKTYLVTPGT